MDVDREFQNWVQNRDPDALARVFDATAGRLLLVAAHLSGPRRSGSLAGPEDLVQATFLAAMDRAETWDPSRPLWPWLTAILQNEARMRLRSARRRREVGLEQATDTTHPGPDPAATAASDEAFASLVAAIDELPVTYRQALRLRLVHGLGTVEIARALERPVGTVRAQLSRGMDRLRQSLPAALGPALAVWLTGGEDLLAAVRQRVLERAMAPLSTAAATAGTATTLLGGWWIMNGKNLTLALVAGVALLGALFAVLAPGVDGPDPEDPVAPPTARVADGRGTPPHTEAEPGDDAARTDVDGPPDPRAAWPLTVLVREHDEPVEAAAVRVYVGPLRMPTEKTRFDAAWSEVVAEGLTDTSGAFRLSLDAFRERTRLFRSTSGVFVEVQHPRGSSEETMQGLEYYVSNTETHTLEVTFDGRACVFGTVVDANGLPVRGATVHEMLGRGTDVGSADARTDADGRFALPVYELDEGLAWPASVAVFAPSHGTAVATLPTEDREDAARVGGLDLGTITLDAGRPIRGKVVLGDGSPLGDYRLFVARIDAAIADDPAAIRRSFLGEQTVRVLRGTEPPVQHRLRVTTADDGSFVCAGLDPEATYAVTVPTMTNRPLDMAVARPGDTVHIAVEAQLLKLRVEGTRAEHLPGAAVRADVFDPSSDNPSWSKRPDTPPKGQVAGGAWFEPDARGDSVILSPFGLAWHFYTTEEFAETGPLRHETFPGVYRAEQRMVLRPVDGFGSLELVVEDETGAPLPRYGFRLKHLDRRIERNHEMLVPPDDRTYRNLPTGRWKLTVLCGPPLQEVFGFGTPSRGRHEQELLITRGETTKVRVASTPAGRVAFRLSSESPPADQHWRGVRVTDLSTGLQVPCVLHSDDQRVSPWPLAQQFLLADRGFAPGRQTFRVQADGYRPIECRVEVADRRLTQARVVLTPE